ncbi:uncharacterized protein LOC111382036 [Olea europaea var. sylvestris]|uniref:uncharacterized protein LOC111382036 n=1 Tax=Olea europaea var. sylvestris TaxID=158386 RepID=UPI000C1CDBAF|nr:uncharacterized protein LOC111382036 [Olea europaea var. sylvestris]
MRLVICVDESHLKGQYKETLLVAATQDANLQMYPPAWSVVDGETNASWYWFFVKLKDVIDNSNQLCLHLAYRENLIAKYSSSNVIFLFKWAVPAYRISKFDLLMTEIRTIRPSMTSYLERAGISTWSWANFVGNRYNIMTNNIAESLNSVLRRQQSFPITSLVENITSSIQRWFYERKSASTKYSTTVTPKIDDELRKSFNASATLLVRNLDELFFKVGVATELCTINLIGNTCSCREFQMRQISYSHASRATYAKEKSLYELCSSYYTTECWRAAYNEVLYPVDRESD